jgi:DNA-binding IclR family transcriptional regulator
MSTEHPMGILQRSAGLVGLLAERGPLTPAEIAERLDLPRPSVYRLADALRDGGLAELLPDARIQLSLRWLRLADAARAGMSEWSGARPILDELAAVTRQTVFLSVPAGDRSVCIDWARGEAINVLLLKPGRSLPLYAGAAGRVTLAFGLEDREAYLANAPFEPYTRRTLTTAAKLRKDIALTRDQGFVVSDGDVTEEIGALGAPLLRGTKHPVFAGALSLAGLADELIERRAELVAELRSAATALAATVP